MCPADLSLINKDLTMLMHVTVISGELITLINSHPGSSATSVGAVKG